MENSDTNVGKKEIIKILIGTMVPFSFILIAGDFHWVAGWFFVLYSSFQIFLRNIYLYFKNPELLKERFSQDKLPAQKNWDKLFILFTIIFLAAWGIVMALDKRFHWSMNFPFRVKVLGLLFLILSSYFVFRALADNSFASHTVRIQEDRKQHVVSTGVYAFVRHPLYLGGVLSYIGAPMFLSSIPGFVLGIFVSLLFALRILGEEKMLEGELEGYIEYEKKVKYRLVPFIW